MRSPRGSSVYLIIPLIDLFPFPPVAGSEYSNGIVAKRKPHGQDSTVDPTEAIMASLA